MQTNAGCGKRRLNVKIECLKRVDRLFFFFNLNVECWNRSWKLKTNAECRKQMSSNEIKCWMLKSNVEKRMQIVESECWMLKTNVECWK